MIQNFIMINNFVEKNYLSAINLNILSDDPDTYLLE